MDEKPDGGAAAVAEPHSEFREFVIGSQVRLVNFAEFLTGDRSRAEDLVQDAYAKAFTRWSRLRLGSPEAYVRRCILNGRSDWWRRRATRERLVDHRDLITPDPNDAARQVDDRVEVLAALGRLTARERTVMVMRYYLDLSEAEIATELRLAPGTVKSTAARAATKLRVDPLLSERRTP